MPVLLDKALFVDRSPGRRGKHEVVRGGVQGLGHVPQHRDDLWAYGDRALALLRLRRIVLAERARCPHRQPPTPQVEGTVPKPDRLPRTQSREELREHEREPVAVLPPVVVEEDVALFLGEGVRSGSTLSGQSNAANGSPVTSSSFRASLKRARKDPSIRSRALFTASPLPVTLSMRPIRKCLEGRHSDRV
jgi:hypothetical protein